MVCFSTFPPLCLSVLFLKFHIWVKSYGIYLSLSLIYIFLSYTHTYLCHNFLRKYFLMFIFYIGETETEREQGRGRERGRYRTRSRIQAPSCQHHRGWHRAQIHGLQHHYLNWNWMLNWLSHPGAPHNFFIRSLVDGHLDCSQNLTIVDNVAINIGLHVSHWVCSFVWKAFLEGRLGVSVG